MISNESETYNRWIVDPDYNLIMLNGQKYEVKDFTRLPKVDNLPQDAENYLPLTIELLDEKKKTFTFTRGEVSGGGASVLSGETLTFSELKGGAAVDLDDLLTDLHTSIVEE